MDAANADNGAAAAAAAANGNNGKGRDAEANTTIKLCWLYAIMVS